MARPRRNIDSPDTATQILMAAREEFALRGSACRLEDIAARCGIRRASLLHHFASKQALIDTLMQQLVDKMRDRLAAAVAASRGDYATTIRAVTDALRQLEHEERGTTAIALHALLNEPGSSGLLASLRAMIELVTSLALEAGADEHRPAAEIRAAIAHLTMAELSRLALGTHASEIWGEGDALWPLTESYFIEQAAPQNISSSAEATP